MSVDPQALIRAGDEHRAAGRWAEAERAYRQAGAKSAAFARLGELYEAAGRRGEALDAHQKALRLEPWQPEHPHRVGSLLLAAGRTEEAITQFRRAVAVGPAYFPAWAMLGQCYGNQGRMSEAESAYRRAIAAQPNPKARIALATLLPPIYDSQEQLEAYAEGLPQRLAELRADGVRVDPTREPIPNLFLLAYQGGNARDTQRAFASLFEPPPEWREPRRPPRAADGRIRLAIVSEYLRNHTIGTLNRGLVERIDRRRFHLTVASAAGADDDTARVYRQRADRYIPLPQDPPGALGVLRDVPLDIVFYPDLGMSCLTLALAHVRLAPVQCVAWGHPLTTGIPTIDYFLSGELYETPEADEHYTERLVRLRGLQTCYPRPEAPAARRRAVLGLPERGRLYGCPQTLFKMHPEFDGLLAGILRRDPAGRLVLVEGKHTSWNERLLARWRRAMPEVLDRVVFLKPLARADFIALLAACDVLLDPLHFGGGNTTLEALSVGTPVITWPTPFLRSRLAQGQYRHLGWLDCVVDSAERYVERAVELGADADAQSAARREILARADALFDDADSVRAFEEFFAEAVGE